MGIRLAPVAHKATSNHPPFFFSFVPPACYDTAWWANQRESICLCRVLTPIPFAVWNFLSSLSKIHIDSSLLLCLGYPNVVTFSYWTTLVKPTCQYKKKISPKEAAILDLISNFRRRNIFYTPGIHRLVSDTESRQLQHTLLYTPQYVAGCLNVTLYWLALK